MQSLLFLRAINYFGTYKENESLALNRAKIPIVINPCLYAILVIFDGHKDFGTS